MISAEIKLILLAIWSIALLGSGGAVAWKWQEVRYLQLQEQIAQDHIKELERVNLEHDKYVISLEQSRAVMMQNIKDKLDENARLSSDVDNARKRLRILVLQQKPCTTAEAASAGGAESGYAELDADSRQAYFDLRDGIVKQEELLGFCINHVKSLSEKQ